MVRGLPVDLGEQHASPQRSGATLVLERYDVFRRDAGIVVHRADGPVVTPVPQTSYFRGSIAEVPGSVAVLAIRADGSVDGHVAADARFWTIASESPDGPAVLREIVPPAELGEQIAAWRCGAGKLSRRSPAPGAREPAPLLQELRPGEAYSPVYEVEVAVDTDYEYVSMFASPSDALDWIGTMFTFVSAVYERDVGAKLVISHADIRAGGTTADPWSATASTMAALLEFGTWWHGSRTAVARDIAHLLSGKVIGGGIAWISVLCAEDFCLECLDEACTVFGACDSSRPDLWGGGYGVSSGLAGRSSATEHVWDLYVFGHEIGHNFGSIHTHCYAPPVDQCWSQEPGCYLGPEGVPSGGGSIMSYCHLQPGGLENVFQYLGAENRFGNQSLRVPAQMRSHVLQRASCFEPEVAPTPTPPAATPTPQAPVLGLLENPQPGSPQSGIGLVSGWVCNAASVQFRIDDGPLRDAAYGTSRLDTVGVCGDANNGFGALLNWNVLGDGAHTLRAFADGVELGSATFGVTTLGSEFLVGASGAYQLEGFPSAGTSVLLRWQQGSQNFVVAGAELVSGAPPASGAPAAAALGVLENPAPLSFQSGIGVISGWVCSAGQVTLSIDGAAPVPAAYGTSRLDTVSVCGDANNGYGRLVNWNLLGDGTHTMTAFADSMAFGEATFTVTTMGSDFVSGASGRYVLPGFVGRDVTVEWQEGQQNFVITGAQPASTSARAQGGLPAAAPD
ncbi:MAG: M12 family metallo-peptidase [Thermodesulfobacteriota bacterium]